MRDGDHESADVRASALPPRDTIATERHIHGLECDGVASAARLRAEAATTVNRMLRLTAAAGGRASELMAQLEQAHSYLSGPAAARERASDGGWRAYQRVIAADLHKVDWSVSGDADPRAEKLARDELASEMAFLVVGVGVVAKDARCEWQRAAASEVAWRQDSEAWRERLRVVVRAWRECCDAARVRPMGHGVLAAKLAQGPHRTVGRGASRLWSLGWHAHVLVEWMRLVRGTVGHGRRQQRRQQDRSARQPAASDSGSDGGGDGRGAHGDTAGGQIVGDGARLRAQPLQRSVEARSGGSARFADDGSGPPRDPSLTVMPLQQCGVCEEDDNSDDDATPAQPRRTRKSDTLLALRPRAQDGLRSLFGSGGDDARLAHARLPRGDG